MLEQFNYLPHSDLLELRRWNTPTVYNGWEAITKRDRLACNMSREAITDFTPSMGAMVGYAVTVEYIASDKQKHAENPDAFIELYKYLASIPGPKVMMCKDLDAPNSIGSIFGEVTGNAYRALGAVGAITDGYARDIDEACYGGFKIMAKRLGVGHAYSCPVRFGCEIELLGTTVKPGMLVHADQYGFIAIPQEETKHLPESVRFMDSNECKNTIRAGREVIGKSPAAIAEAMKEAGAAFAEASAKFKASLTD